MSLEKITPKNTEYAKQTLRNRGDMFSVYILKLIESFENTEDNLLDYVNELEQLTIPVVVGQSEQLKPMVFELANKLAIAGHGNEAVSMHRIHNRL